MVATEIIIYLGSDGTDEFDRSPKPVRVELITSTNSTHIMTPETIFVLCAHSPVHVPVTKDLTTPFFTTKGISFIYCQFSFDNIFFGGRWDSCPSNYDSKNSRCRVTVGVGMLKNPHCSMVVSAEHRPLSKALLRRLLTVCSI